MPRLIKDIEGQVNVNIEGNIKLLSPIVSVTQGDDYVNMCGLIACIQNLKQVQFTAVAREIPAFFGLPNNYNLETQIIDINY